MISDESAAVKLYSLLYRGSNLYSAKVRKGDLTDPVQRYTKIVKEFRDYLKANENG